MPLYYPPTRNALQKTLDSQLDQGVTSAMTLNNTTGVQNKPGVVVVNRISSSGAELSASVREFIAFTGVSGNTLTGLTRNVDGSSTDQDHAVGSVVEFIFDAVSGQAIIDALLKTVDDNGDLDATKIIPATYLDTDTALTANSDTKVATQKATKAYTDNRTTTFGIQVFDSATDTATGDAKAYFRVPSQLNGFNLTAVAGTVYTAGTTGTTDIQLRNKTDSVDMLSTKLTIDSGETDSSTAATAAVIDTTKDDVATGDVIAIDVDAVSTTKAKGLYIELTFTKP